jgi:hypothetical protein
VDLIDELEVAQRTHQVSDEDLFEMVTVRAASVLRLTEGEGTVREGGVADLIVVEDRGQTPAEAVARLRPELVIVRGRVRLISPRLLDRASAVCTGAWHSVDLEVRGRWLTDVNLPSLHQETIGALGPEYRLAGKRVSL